MQGVFFSEGEQWKRERRLISPAFNAKSVAARWNCHQNHVCHLRISAKKQVTKKLFHTFHHIYLSVYFHHIFIFCLGNKEDTCQPNMSGKFPIQKHRWDVGISINSEASYVPAMTRTTQTLLRTLRRDAEKGDVNFTEPGLWWVRRGQMDSQILWKSYGRLRNWTDVSWWVNLRAHQVLSMFIIIHDIIIVYPWHGTPFSMQGGSATVPPGAFASLHCGCAVCYCFWQRSGHVGDQKDRACPRCQEAQRTAREQVCLFKDEGLPNSVLRNYGGFLGLPPVDGRPIG